MYVLTTKWNDWAQKKNLPMSCPRELNTILIPLKIMRHKNKKSTNASSLLLRLHQK